MTRMRDCLTYLFHNHDIKRHYLYSSQCKLSILFSTRELSLSLYSVATQTSSSKYIVRNCNAMGGRKPTKSAELSNKIHS